MRAAGLYEPELEWLNPAPSSLALGGQLFGQIMRQQLAVDAIFFCNYDLAQGALLAALTTVRTPRAEIGQAAARMLLALMHGETVATRGIDLGYQLVVRAST